VRDQLRSCSGRRGVRVESLEGVFFGGVVRTELILGVLVTAERCAVPLTRVALDGAAGGFAA
jgi:hypothetical protein